MKSVHDTTILRAIALNFSYPDRQLFTNFSMYAPPGITLIRGGDGRGKSTLLRLLARAQPAQSGQLQINGVDLQTQPANYKAKVFWADPRSAEFDQLAVPEYFELQRRCHAGFDHSMLADVVQGLGLQEHLHKQLFMLSTGTKRKVFLAAAFASGAALTLLDEPFAAVDTASIGFILSCLKVAAEDGSRDWKRAWVMADYVAPDRLHLEQIIDLGD